MHGAVDAKSEGEVEEITPINCEVGEWELHPANGKPCVFQTGNLKCFSSNVRSIAVEPAHGGESCPSLSETVECACPAVAGDGHKVGSEVCDDGNVENGDGCSADGATVESGWVCSGGDASKADLCLAASCGDGVRAGAEECDDGNNADNDGCASDCKVESGEFFCEGG